MDDRAAACSRTHPSENEKDQRQTPQKEFLLLSMSRAAVRSSRCLLPKVVVCLVPLSWSNSEFVKQGQSGRSRDCPLLEGFEQFHDAVGIQFRSTVRIGRFDLVGCQGPCRGGAPTGNRILLPPLNPSARRTVTSGTGGACHRPTTFGAAVRFA